MRDALHWRNSIILLITSVLFGLYSWQENFVVSVNKKQSLPANLPSPSDRTPAQVNFGKSNHRFGTSIFEIVDIGCIDSSSTNLIAAAEMIRISGKICKDNSQNRLRKIVALAPYNSPLTAFFDPNSARFGTEIFPLSQEINLITIEFTYANGQTRKNTFSIKRIPPTITTQILPPQLKPL